MFVVISSVTLKMQYTAQWENLWIMFHFFCSCKVHEKWSRKMLQHSRFLMKWQCEIWLTVHEFKVEQNEFRAEKQLIFLRQLQNKHFLVENIYKIVELESWKYVFDTCYVFLPARRKDAQCPNFGLCFYISIQNTCKFVYGDKLLWFLEKKKQYTGKHFVEIVDFLANWLFLMMC